MKQKLPSGFYKSGKTTDAESKFKYDDGKTRADYSTDFVPKFIEEADHDQIKEAEDKCGETNVQCIFDYVFTGDEEIAEETLSTQVQAEASSEEAGKYICKMSKHWLSY